MSKVAEKRPRDGPGVFKEVLGLKGEDPTGEWAKIWASVKDILHRRELVGTKLSPLNDEEQKNEIIAEIEALHRKAFEPLEASSRQNILHRILKYGLENFKRKREHHQGGTRKRLPKPETEQNLAGVLEESLTDSPGPGQKEPIINLGLPSIPEFEIQLMRQDLVEDGELSLAKVFKILDEEGIHCDPDSYAVFDALGKRLLLPRHLSISFQALLNEEKLESQWLVLKIGEEWFPGRKFALPASTPIRASSSKTFSSPLQEPGSSA